MTLLEMAAAIAHCDAAMIAERVDPSLRAQVLDRFGKSMARVVMLPTLERRPGCASVEEPLLSPPF